MAMSYKKLWKQLIDRDMTRGDLHQITGVAPSTLTKMSKGECVATNVIERICVALKCDVGDIMEVIADENELTAKRVQDLDPEKIPSNSKICQPL